MKSSIFTTLRGVVHWRSLYLHLKNVSATVYTSKFVREINLPTLVEFSVKYVLDGVFCLSKHSILLESTTFQYMHEFSSRKYSNVKLEKFKRGRPPSLHLAKEGDFAWNHTPILILSINIQIPAEILKKMR